jgi:NAD(P)-dependent dehydrogenase (short-subunit alcohol dehydrogenase family)
MPSPTPFSGQAAIITGGASGLGLAIARRLRDGGAFVALFDRDEKPFAALDAELAGGGRCFRVDVTDEASVAQAIGEVLKLRGKVQILVNSAGITGKTNVQTHEVELADFESVFRINVRGPFLTAKHVLPAMKRDGYGRILHIASIAGKEGNAGMLAYSASKAAVIGMTKVQGKEYAGTGITVNALAPAVVQTPMVEAMPEAQVKYMTDKIPMKRCCTLDEVAAMAAFIVSPEAAFTTAFTFDLTGGRATY